MYFYNIKYLYIYYRYLIYLNIYEIIYLICIYTYTFLFFYDNKFLTCKNVQNFFNLKS